MKTDSHLSDAQLLLHLEGELPRREEKQTLEHIHACWICRTRQRELEESIESFVRARGEEFREILPPAAGPRALLRVRMAELPTGRHAWNPLWLAAAVCFVLMLGFSLTRLTIRHGAPSVFIPDSRLTPGATLLVSRSDVCSLADTSNKPVPAALRRRVFEEYGISGVDPRAYEVDYLVTPALGGADDIHNLWPHSYSSTVWNAQVKDALEDRLRRMVCDGSLDLTEAQREIAGNWIAAYKKYFHTEQPIETR